MMEMEIWRVRVVMMEIVRERSEWELMGLELELSWMLRL